MPPTHPSQADVAAAYRTLIAHETEPKEQDFYRTRLQRLEQATEPVCEFDCRSRVAAAGVGVYCPQCSAKCADTDLTTQLAKAYIDALHRSGLTHNTWAYLPDAQRSEIRHGMQFVEAHLQSTGRLIPAGGMALTAEDVRKFIIAIERHYPEGEAELLARLRAPFPATEPAEEETKAESFEAALDAGMDEMRWEIDEKGGEVFESAKKAIGAALFKFSLDASSPVVPTPTETGPWQHRVNGEICVASPASGLPYTIGKFNDHGDFVWHSSSAELPEGFAPFVAAEEG